MNLFIYMIDFAIYQFSTVCSTHNIHIQKYYEKSTILIHESEP